MKSKILPLHGTLQRPPAAPAPRLQSGHGQRQLKYGNMPELMACQLVSVEFHSLYCRRQNAT